MMLAIVLARGLGVAGVALAASLQFLFGFLAQVAILRRYYTTFSPRAVIGKSLEYGGWAGLSALAVRMALDHGYPMSGHPLSLLMGMLAGAAGIAAVYIGGLLLVQEPDCLALIRSVRGRLQSRSRLVAPVVASTID
jgi:hypothetical protein